MVGEADPGGVLLAPLTAEKVVEALQTYEAYSTRSLSQPLGRFQDVTPYPPSRSFFFSIATSF